MSATKDKNSVTFLSCKALPAVLTWRKVFFQQLNTSLRVHAIFYIVVAGYLIGYELFKQATGTSHTIAVTGWLWNFVIIGFLVPAVLPLVLAVRFIRMAIYVRPEKPTLYLIKDVLGIVLSPQRIANALPVILTLAFLVDIFSFIKPNIPLLRPFTWDKTFMELDRALHFGHDPWHLLHPILGHWQITQAFNVAYNLWFFVMYGVTLWIASEKKQSVVQMQYLLAFFLCWTVGGSLLATIFSSAGPVYYGHVVPGPNPFKPLLDYLHAANGHGTLGAVGTQSILWQCYKSGTDSPGSGISAMPSMHNASTMLIAILSWHSRRKTVAISGTLFAVTIFLGSILLGWHYAVDGYMAFILAALLWWMSGHIIRWYLRLPFVAGIYAAALDDQGMHQRRQED